MSYQVTFAEVGRNKVTWSQSLDQDPTEAILARMVRKKKILMSSDISCEFDEDLEHGVIGSDKAPATLKEGAQAELARRPRTPEDFDDQIPD